MLLTARTAVRPDQDAKGFIQSGLGNHLHHLLYFMDKGVKEDRPLHICYSVTYS